MSERPPERVIDNAALAGLAHPLRVRIFDELSAHGPATSSELGRRFGESSGATSYHLRQLARHGFVEEVPERGSARERWWRAAPESFRLEGGRKKRDPSAAVRQAATLVLSEWHSSRNERFEHWLATGGDWPEDWYESSLDATAHLRLTQPETVEFRNEIDALVTRWADKVRHRREHDVADDQRDVELQINLFPLEPR